MLFKSRTIKMAENLVDVIFRYSEIFLNQKVAFPNGENSADVECALVGLTSFLVSGFADNSDLDWN